MCQDYGMFVFIMIIIHHIHLSFEAIFEVGKDFFVNIFNNCLIRLIFEHPFFFSNVVWQKIKLKVITSSFIPILKQK